MLCDFKNSANNKDHAERSHSAKIIHCNFDEIEKGNFRMFGKTKLICGTIFGVCL